MYAKSDLLAMPKLAIDGGPPAMKHSLPPMYPGGMRMGPEEEKAVLDVLRSKRLFRYYGPYSGGSKVDEFEKAFAVQMGTDLVVRFIHMIPRVWPNFGAQSALDGICPGNKRLSRTTR